MRTETTAESPSRTSLPSRFLSLSLRRLIFLAYSLKALVHAAFIPASCVPPSLVRTLLTNDIIVSEYPSLYWPATSTSIPSFLPSKYMTGPNTSLSSFKYSTNSLIPSAYKNSSSVYGSVLSSVKVIFTPFNKKADSLNLSAKVLKLYFVVEKILSSGLNVTFVPLLRLALPILRKVPTGCPPLTKSSSYSIPSRTVFTVNFEESALTTEAPTPCSPPEVL